MSQDVPAPSQEASGNATVIRSSAVMAAGTLVSRVLGMVRVAAQGWAIGLLFAGDAFTVANTVPNTLYILLAGGVLNAVLVPQITRAMRRQDGGREYVDRLLTMAVALMALVTVVVTVASPAVIWIYGRDGSDDLRALATAFAFWTLPQVFFYGLYTLLGQVLNARGSFGPYMWAPVLNNLVAIAGLVVFVAVTGMAGDRGPARWTTGAVALLAGTATLGVVAQALVLVPVLRRTGFVWRPRWGVRGVGLRTASRIAGWTFATVLTGQIGFTFISNVTVAAAAGIERLADPPLRPGPNAYAFAFLLFMLPHSLATVSLVTALFPRMSRQAAGGDVDAVRSSFSLGLRVTGVATVIATVTVLALGRDLTASLWFTQSLLQTDAIAYVAMAMVLGLATFSAQYLMQRVFYAFEDARTPFLVQVPMTLVWVVGSEVALWLLPAYLVVIGVGLALSLSSVVGAVATAVLLRRRLGHLDGGRVARTYRRLLIAAVPAGVAGWAVARGIHALADPSRLASPLALVTGGTVVLGVYVAVLRLMGVRELDDLVAPLTARLRRRRGRHL